MPELVELRIQAFHRLIKLVDKVIALCEWARKLLIRNGVPQSKIALCRQGIAWEAGDYSNNHPPPRPELPIRAAFLGRLDPTKGVHIVVEALKHNAALAVQLDLFGVRQGQVGDQYASRVGELIAGDTRIQIMPPVSPDKVVHQLREYDVLVVPSQWMETGPLVVLEAFAAGIPVMGSNLGGIAELVRDGVDGLLIEPASSPLAWAASFRRLCSNPAELSSLRKGIRRSRHTREVALELMPLYGRSVKITPKVSKYKRPQTNKIR
jgi:glycosyltransferase involved in cell wall biosynthesis